MGCYAGQCHLWRYLCGVFMCNCNDDNGGVVRPTLDASRFVGDSYSRRMFEVFVKQYCEAIELVLPITYTELSPHSPMLYGISKMMEQLVNEQPDLMRGLMEGKLMIQVDPDDTTLRFVPTQRED